MLPGYSSNSCLNSQDLDGDGLAGCADPDCQGGLCMAGCNCNAGYCEDATGNVCQ